MHVSVYGGSGFLGHHLLRLLINNDEVERITAYSRKNSVFKLQSNKLVIKNIDFHNNSEYATDKADLTFFLIANSSVKYCSDNPTEATFNNYEIFKKYIENGNQHPTVFASTILTYTTIGYSLIVNDDVDLRPKSWYGITKLAAEGLCSEKFCKIVRLPALVGEYATKGALYDILSKFKATRKNNVIKVYGDYPGSFKPFVCADEAALSLFAAGMNLINDVDSPHIYVTVPKDTISINSIIQIGERYYDKRRVFWDNTQVWKDDTPFVEIEYSNWPDIKKEPKTSHQVIDSFFKESFK